MAAPWPLAWSAPPCRPKRRWRSALPGFLADDFATWIALDVGIHWLGDPWALWGLPHDDQVELLAYRHALLGRRASGGGRRTARGRLHLEDLRAASVGPASFGDHLVLWQMTRPQHAEQGQGRGDGLAQLFARYAHVPRNPDIKPDCIQIAE